MVYRQGGRLVILQLRINQDFLKLAENGDFWVQNRGSALPNINTAEGMADKRPYWDLIGYPALTG